MTMKLHVLTAVLCAALTSACTTVEITNTAPSTALVSKPSMDSTLLKRTASRLTSFFHTKGWCPDDGMVKKQSAAQILLEGLKSGEDRNITLPDYDTANATPATLISDIKMAHSHVDQTTTLARRVLTAEPSDATLRDELTLLETALISARQAEDTFSRALHDRNMSGVATFDSYTNSVNDLRAVTDAFGNKLRGKSPLDTNG